MKTFDEYTKRELAEMSDDDFESLPERAAMEKGLAKPPELPSINDRPTETITPPSSQDLWLVSIGNNYNGPNYIDSAFACEQDAEEVAAVIRKHAIGTYQHSHYSTPTWTPGKVSEARICRANVPDKVAAEVWKSKHDASRSRLQAWEAERNRLKAEHEKYNLFVGGLIARRAEAIVGLYGAKQVAQERQRFAELAGGDRSIGDRFLEQRNPGFLATLTEFGLE